MSEENKNVENKQEENQNKLEVNRKVFGLKTNLWITILDKFLLNIYNDIYLYPSQT